MLRVGEHNTDVRAGNPGPTGQKGEINQNVFKKGFITSTTNKNSHSITKVNKGNLQDRSRVPIPILTSCFLLMPH